MIFLTYSLWFFAVLVIESTQKLLHHVLGVSNEFQSSFLNGDSCLNCNFRFFDKQLVALEHAMLPGTCMGRGPLNQQWQQLKDEIFHQQLGE